MYAIRSYYGMILEDKSLRIAEIIVDEAHADIDRVFDYYIQADSTNISAGSRVLVPFGSRKIEGFVIKVKDTTEVPKSKMKSIVKALDEYPVLTEKQLELAQWMKRQYSCLLIYALRVMLPSPVRGGSASAKQQKYAGLTFDAESYNFV